jgi:aminopeptidase
LQILKLIEKFTKKIYINSLFLIYFKKKGRCKACEKFCPTGAILFDEEPKDLKIKVGENRKFISTSGHNIPSFEVFTSPDCRFTEGTFYADQPSFRLGNVVKGVRLELKNGKCISKPVCCSTLCKPP